MIEIPDEIWETILEMLLQSSPQSFLVASSATSRWRHLAARLSRKYCIKKFGRNYLRQLHETQVTHQNVFFKENEEEWEEEIWTNMLALHEETKISDSSASFTKINCLKNTKVFAIEPFFILCSYYQQGQQTSSIIKVLNSLIYSIMLPSKLCEEFDRLLSQIKVPFEVLEIHLLVLRLPVLILKSGPKEWIGIPWERHKNSYGHQDFVSMEDCCGHSRISTQSKFVLATENQSSISYVLYEAKLDENSPKIHFEVLRKFNLNVPVFEAKLFKGHIKVIDRNGFLKVYKIPNMDSNLNFTTKTPDKLDDVARPKIALNDASEINNVEDVTLVTTSTFSKDLRYPNKTFLTFGWTFTSTSISSSMLYYWHMDRGRGSNMLIGRINDLDDDLLKNSHTEQEFPLNNLNIGREEGYKVKSVTKTRGLLVCGTTSGCLLVYKLEEESLKRYNNLEFLEGPPHLKVVGLTENKIQSVEALCTSSGVLVGVLDKENNLTIGLIPVGKC